MDDQGPTDSGGINPKFTKRDLQPEPDWQMPPWMAGCLGMLTYKLGCLLMVMLPFIIIVLLVRWGFIK